MKTEKKLDNGKNTHAKLDLYVCTHMSLRSSDGNNTKRTEPLYLRNRKIKTKIKRPTNIQMHIVTMKRYYVVFPDKKGNLLRPISLNYLHV